MSVLVDFQVSNRVPSTVSTSGTSAAYFTRPIPSLTAIPTTPSATNASGQLPYPGLNEMNGANARIALAGTVTTGAALTATINLQANTGTLISPVYTTLASVSKAIGSAKTAAWYIVADVEGDSGTIGSGQLSGTFYGMIDTTPALPAGLSNSLSSLNFSNNPPFGLVVNVTFGTGNPSNAAQLTQFSIVGY